jgi:hypothetical protein
MKSPLARRFKTARQKIKMLVWPALLRLAWPVVWLRRRLRPHKISLSRVEGVIGGDGCPLAVLCGAVKQNKDYLLQLLFSSVTRETELGTVRLLDAFRPEFSRGKDFGLVVLETNQSLHGWLDDGGWFFIPCWVTGMVRLPLTEKVGRSDTLRTIKRKIRKHGFEYAVSRTEAQFKDFYENLHVPHISKIYGPAAFCQTYAEMWAKCAGEGFDLVLVRKQSRPDLVVAGCLILYEAAGPRLWALGVRDADLDLVQEGALSTLYYFCFDHVLKQGFGRLNMGGCRSFLRDGVLTFKKRLSQTLVHGRWEGFALKVLELTPATRLFLVNNPFLFQSKGRLFGAVFTEAPLTVATVAELDHDHFYPGMSRLLLYFFAGVETFQVADLPPELAARVEIRPAAGVVSGDLHLP